jgi:hypothetical protein
VLHESSDVAQMQRLNQFSINSKPLEILVKPGDSGTKGRAFCAKCLSFYTKPILFVQKVQMFVQKSLTSV